MRDRHVDCVLSCLLSLAKFTDEANNWHTCRWTGSGDGTLKNLVDLDVISWAAFLPRLGSTARHSILVFSHELTLVVAMSPRLIRIWAIVFPSQRNAANIGTWKHPASKKICFIELLTGNCLISNKRIPPHTSLSWKAQTQIQTRSQFLFETELFHPQVIDSISILKDVKLLRNIHMGDHNTHQL